MKNCKKCGDKFEPKKPYFIYCTPCIKEAAKCKTCGKIVFPNDDGKLVCCGHDEYPMRERVRSMQETLNDGLHVSSFGGGLTAHRYGVMEYCDDGNGNEWSMWEDYDDEH